jgi:hypothetical protein
VAAGVGVIVGVALGVKVTVGVRGVGDGISVAVDVGTGVGSNSGLRIDTIHSAPLAAESTVNTTATTTILWAFAVDLSLT